MTIQEVPRQECLDLLATAKFGRLGCSQGNQPYVVPIYFASYQATFGESYLYAFTTIGRKIEWMRSNPLVCVEWDEIKNYNDWVSVIATGRYEELPEAPETNEAHATLRAPARATPTPDDSIEGLERMRALELLSDRFNWWEPSYATFAAHLARDQNQPYVPIYYRIRIDEITGRRVCPKLT